MSLSTTTTNSRPAPARSAAPLRNIFGLRELAWTLSHLSTPKRVWATLHPELERGTLAQHDFLVAYTSDDLHASASLPLKGLAAGGGAAIALLGVAHLVAIRMRVPGLLRGAARQSPLVLPFIAAAPLSLGYTLGGMAQATRQEAFCSGLDDRGAFARAMQHAAERESDWFGGDVFGEQRLRAWATRLTSHGQAGTLAPRKGELDAFMKQEEEQGDKPALLADAEPIPHRVDDDFVVVDAPHSPPSPGPQPWWKLW